MTPDESFHKVVKKYEIPHLPQQDINSFLNATLKQTQVAARLTEQSGDIGKRLASMASAADLSCQLLGSFDSTKNLYGTKEIAAANLPEEFTEREERKMEFGEEYGND